MSNHVAREVAAELVFRSNCFRFYPEGKPVALNQIYPDAPLSPYYLDLPPGRISEDPLAERRVSAISYAMHLYGEEVGLFAQDRAVTGIPKGGIPFAEKVRHQARKVHRGKRFPWLSLVKEIEDGKRRFRLSKERNHRLPDMEDVLMMDDLINTMATKTLAMEPILSAGGDVTDILVFLIRGEELVKRMEAIGVRLWGVWEFHEFIDWSRRQEHLSDDQVAKILAYQEAIKGYEV